MSISSRRNDATLSLPRRAEAFARTEPLRHLLLHVEAALDVDERMALYDALWTAVARLDAAGRHAAARQFDGRHQGLLGWFSRPVGHPASVTAVAWAHLGGDRLLAADPGFVLRWIARHGQDGCSELSLCAVRARIAGAGWAGMAGDEALLADQATCLGLLEAPALGGLALCTLFDLAIVAGSEDAALRLLAACVERGVQAQIAPAALRAWIECGSDAPLMLRADLQALWLRPAALGQSTYRAALAAALVRADRRARVLMLHALLGGDAAAASPSGPGFRALSALDGLYAAAESGGVIADPAARLLDEKILAPSATAAVQRRVALEAIGRADPHAAAIALCGARGANGEAQDGAVLQQLLMAVDEAAASDAAAVAGLAPDAVWFDGGWQREEPLWRALTSSSSGHLKPIAQYHLGMLYSHGSLVPCVTHKTQRLHESQSLWEALASQPAYAAMADAESAHPVRQLMRKAEVRGALRRHAWVQCAEAGAHRLMIVFSCVESHHTFTQMTTLGHAMRDHHLLFIDNPELNWYSDAVFDQVCELIEQRVLPHFAREDVCCHFGSMGGHAALKFALRFGFQAVVFNPQIDLALWAAFRPQQRPMLLAAHAHANVQDAPLAAFEQSPVYYMVGSSAADREAFAIWLGRVQHCAHGNFIIEKFADPHHAGLIARVVPRGRVPELLQRGQARLRELTRVCVPPASHAEVPAVMLPRFWQRLDLSASIKLEIVIREGRVFVADSGATGTV